MAGDAFLIICANTPLDGALLTAEKVRREVSALRVPAGNGFWMVSVGVATRLHAPPYATRRISETPMRP